MHNDSNNLIKNYPGIFIAIDGPNGSGKTTLINNVINELSRNFPDYECLRIREPSESDIGALIRKYSEKKLHKGTLLYLVAADRQYNHVEFIHKKIGNRKSIIISDRYITSTFVYQIMHGLTVHEILPINCNICIPDMIFIIETSNEEIRQRLKERGSNNLFENPNNVEVENELFSKSQEILEPLGYAIYKVHNSDLNLATKTIYDKLTQIISNKARF